jgi:(1->4)-alpha-D-glucan 1-alpha-D-glucosylmutase
MLFSSNLMTFRKLRDLSASSLRAQASRDTDISNPPRSAGQSAQPLSRRESQSPGVPDFYQGTELWNLALVDPDNRQLVDFELRRRLLADLKNATPEKVMSRIDEGMPKLWLIRQGLALHKRHPEWFGPQAAIEPIEVRGARRDHVVAFRRGASVATVVPRLVAKLNGDWRDMQIELPRGEWMNHLTGERPRGGHIRLAELMRRFPVALLSRGGSRP